VLNLQASLVAGLAACATATYTEANYDALGWTPTLAEKFAPVSFTFSVKQQNMEELKRVAMEVSTPDHPSYGQFLNTDQIDTMTAPAASDVTTVTKWLSENDIEFTVDRENIRCETTVIRAARLLNTGFYSVSHPSHAAPLVRAGDFDLPPAVDAAVATVFGLQGLPLPPRAPILVDESVGATPAIVTPDVINKDYGISGVTPSGSTTFRQAVAEFQGQFMNATDLSTFFTNYLPDAKAGEEKVFKFVGAPAKDGSGVEALLDIQ
jgi:tripeptidyl-peptidase-1